MDQILNKVGSYWLGQKANKEIDSVGDDLNINQRIAQGANSDALFVHLFSTPCVLHVYLSLLTFLVLTSSFLPFNQSLSTSIEGGAKWLVNKIKGKMQKPLPELLREYNLPIGIFPRDATNYEFNEETGKLTVFIPAICEVGYKDSSVLRFFTTVTGYLEKGKLADIEGMKTKVMIWVKVTSITCEGSKIYVTAGMKKSRNREAYEVSRDGVSVDKF
ncbi:hypothetical protein GOBAR_AA31754 [Gossypium barbadense]|uniref:DUF538 domain-containing protein n=1 Tax=Gossypium barbadense TaxID=3634 RepID=A0A2P5WCW4_GOSBA|nr:hypothetical protein GOBAR_AA31754 [Gossypium barbadense]